MLNDDDYDEILRQFPEGIVFAFAYGSGVVKQSGYNYSTSPGELPMLDLIIVVDNTELWHTKNMVINPSHYSPILPVSLIDSFCSLSSLAHETSFPPQIYRIFKINGEPVYGTMPW